MKKYHKYQDKYQDLLVMFEIIGYENINPDILKNYTQTEIKQIEIAVEKLYGALSTQLYNFILAYKKAGFHCEYTDGFLMMLQNTIKKVKGY